MNPSSEILLVLVLILANGLFAMAEIAIISSRKARLEQQAARGSRGASMALSLSTTPNRFLSTVQVGITLIGILNGAVGGARLSVHLAPALAQIDWLAPYAETIALALVVLVITYLSLVLGELVPKRLAMNNPERIASALAPLMRGLSVITAPAVRLLSVSTDVILRGLGIKPSTEPPVTEDEIRILLEQGTEAGIFQKVEQTMVEKVLLLDDRRISAIMTPRPEVVWLDLDDSPEQLRQKITENAYSRFPVAQGDLDNLLGELHVKDLLVQSWQGQPFDPRAVLHEPLYVSEFMPALQALEAFKRSGSPAAVVIDEYGSAQGMITLTDILEAIVGDIAAPDQPSEPRAIEREDGSWLVDGMLPIDEFKLIFNIEDLPGEVQELYQTVAGFVMMQLEHVPSITERFRWDGLDFEVLDMDGLRVDKVLVRPVLPEPQEPAEDE